MNSKVLVQGLVWFSTGHGCIDNSAFDVTVKF